MMVAVPAATMRTRPVFSLTVSTRVLLLEKVNAPDDVERGSIVESASPKTSPVSEILDSSGVALATVISVLTELDA